MSKRTTLLALTLAIVLSGAVTAGAKTIITGKQIKNNSITGADIKDRSVKSSDLSVGVALYPEHLPAAILVGG